MTKTPTSADYRFDKKTAADLYDELALGRTQVIEKARELARISVPSAFPPEGYKAGDSLPPPNQSINARAVTTLASRIMLTALPPGFPMLKYSIIEHKLQPEIDKDPALYSMTLMALARREKANRDRLEVTNIRTAYTEAAEQLIIAGNVCWRHMDIDHPSAHRMTDYVTKRSAGGEALKTILKLGVSLEELDPSTAMFIRNVMATDPKFTTQDCERDQQTIYACQKLYVRSKKEKVWLYWEEFNGECIPDSEATLDYSAPILFPAWMKPNYGQNWGTSYAQLYEGDMWIAENGSADLNDMSDAAAITWLFVKPGGVTSKKVLEKAENVRIMHGDAADITVFRLDKTNDASFVQSHVDGAEKRLGQAFLMVSSIQRSGERVTAEEWRQMTSELDMAMGGLYASFAQGLGKNIVTRFLALQEDEDHSLKPLPPGIIRVGVVTGMDAMSLNEEEVNLENALGVLIKVFGPEGMPMAVVPAEVVRRVMAGNAVKPDGLVKNEATQQQETAQATQQGSQQKLLDAVAPPLAKEGAKALMPAITPAVLQAMKKANPQLNMPDAAPAAAA